jgi:CRP-like cAMP-binding protein
MAKSSLLWVDYEKLTHMDEHPSNFIRKINTNITGILANEIFRKDALCEILTKPTIRERLIIYLEIMSKNKGSQTIKTGMTQRELASYLNVSRLCLCTEMNELRKEGVLDYRGKEITILKNSKVLYGQQTV